MTDEFKTITGFGKPAMTEWEWQQKLADDENKRPGKLNQFDKIDCPKCLNRGYTTVLIGDPETDLYPEMAQRRCECMTRREIVRNANASGMGSMLGRKFKDFKVEADWQRSMKQKAVSFAENPEGWFTAIGQIGSGKTLIASCVANQLLRDGHRLLVKSWPELVRESGVDWFKEKEILSKFQKVECLFLDDFLKTKPTDRALDIAFELLDYRYRNGLITLITSEKTPDEIADYDPALWSRIGQMSGDRLVTVSKDQSKDQRRK
ncbi:hypothetical protein [Ileibacterium valens]|uniref:hypothetical protein n=1 Tax=Ileibacterium valens TaxID=1862668 RepID=UPI0025B767DA|nr:hypothetical protein [Ileibacterium valens]